MHLEYLQQNKYLEIQRKNNPSIYLFIYFLVEAEVLRIAANSYGK